MAGNQIAQVWERLATKVASLLSASSTPESQPDSSIREAVSSVQSSVTNSPTPYSPDKRQDRSDSSLHLSS